MHEYSITKNIIDICIEEAKKSEAKSIKEITLVIGELSPFSDESVLVYFNLLSEGSILENAALVIKKQPIELQCKVCGQKFHKQGNTFECINCNGPCIATGNSGNEFYIESMEIE